MTNLVSDGFRVARGLISSQVCDAIRNAFSLEVKNHKQPLLRQRSVAREGHDFSEGHLMTNALLDVHHGMEAFPAFNSAVKGLLEGPSLREPLSTLFGEPAVLVQTMYFESSKGTPAHYDHCFLDSSDGERKELYGAWIALEAIEQAAGRFFLYPYSHWAGTPHAKPDVNRLHAEYVAASREVIDLYDKGPSIKCLRYVKTARGLLDELIEAAGWMPITPTLGKGDVLFFSSRMLHGSHPRRIRSAPAIR